MERTRTMPWWLAPAAIVLLLEGWFVFHELVGGSVFGDVDPRVGVRLGATGVWLAFTFATGIGLALNRRRPRLAGGLLIVGSVPAALMFWAPAVVVIGLATWVGAIYHVASSGSPPARVV